MISIAGNLSDKETLTGFSYFKQKYGLTQAFLTSQISFSEEDYPPVSSGDTIQGWITWKGCRLPVIIPPRDLSRMGSGFLEYTNGESTFPCAVINDRDSIIGIDIFRHLGLFLSGHLEKIWSSQQEVRKDAVRVPFADYYSDILFSSLVQVQAKNHQPLICKTFWPDGKTFAVCLTHDVDEIRKTYQWLTHPARRIARRDWGGLKRQYRSFRQKLCGHEPFWTFDALADIEASFDARSSLFFLYETGKVSLLDRDTWRHAGRRYDFAEPRVRELLLDLYRRGWDVGLHGSFYSYESEEALRSEKERLEQSLGQKVHGGRQHNLNLIIPDTWLYQEKAGLTYDSTLGYNDCLGFRWGFSFPFRPYLVKEDRFSPVLQIPLAIEDLPYFRSPGGWEEFLDIHHRVAALGGMITLLWHHSVFNETEYPGWSEDYAKILGYCKNNNAWVTDAKTIAHWWMEREQNNFRYEYGNGVLKLFPLSDTTGSYLDIILPEGMSVHLLEKAIIINTVNNNVTIRTSPLHRMECVTVMISEFSDGNYS